jgi:hypothetical protein
MHLQWVEAIVEGFDAAPVFQLVRKPITSARVGGFAPARVQLIAAACAANSITSSQV